MSPQKIPRIGWREAIKALAKRGFYVIHQRGSHIYLTDQDRKHKVTVPRHDPIRTGTLLSLIQQAGLTRDEFLKLLD